MFVLAVKLHEFSPIGSTTSTEMFLFIFDCFIYSRKYGQTTNDKLAKKNLRTVEFKTRVAEAACTRVKNRDLSLSRFEDDSVLLI